MVKAFGTELEIADWNCVECTPKLGAIGIPGIKEDLKALQTLQKWG